MAFLRKYNGLEDVEADSLDDLWAKYDKLNRRHIAEQLTHLIDGLTQPYVLSVDAAWGTGKTHFIRLWAYELEHFRNMPVVYINAWETDYSDDPLVVFVDEIVSYIDKDFSTHIAKSKKFNAAKIKNSIIDSAEKIAKKAPFYCIQIAKGVAEKKAGPVVNDIANDLCSSESQLRVNYKNDALVKYRRDKCDRKKFTKQLSDLALYLKKSGERKLPLVVFIDELDRCRPDYALSFLESIKHLFSAPNVLFVLSVDKSQLCNTISTVYGHGVDAHGYLRRFIDFDFLLPDPDVDLFINMLSDYYDASKDNKFVNISVAKSALTLVSSALSMSLRDILQCFDKILIIRKVYHLTVSQMFVCTLLLCIKMKMDDQYKCLKYGGKECAKLFDMFDSMIINNDIDGRLLHSVVEFISMMRSCVLSKDEFDQWKEDVSSYIGQKLQSGDVFDSVLLNAFGAAAFYQKNELRHSIDKVEFASRF